MKYLLMFGAISVGLLTACGVPSCERGFDRYDTWEMTFDKEDMACVTRHAVSRMDDIDYWGAAECFPCSTTRYAAAIQFCNKNLVPKEEKKHDDIRY